MTLAAVSLDDKYAAWSGEVYMTGTQALVRLPMMQQLRDQAAGLDTACMISGYRGSPLGNFDRALWQARPFIEKHNVHFQPGVNEDTAATALWGTQQVGLFPGARHDGVFAIWYGKGPGVDRTIDVFKHATLAGTAPHGGVLALAGDDHVCASSTTAHQSEFDFVSATMPVINPAGVQEFLDYGLHGWGLSRYAGLWVGFICVAETVDSSAIVSVDPHRVTIVTPEDHALPAGGLNIRWPDTPLDQEERLLEHKLDAVRAYGRANGLDRTVIDGPGRRLGIVTTGKSYLDVRQALDDLGIDEGAARRLGLALYKVGM
ncbi:MAG: indolepyruvate ferredoxin oxidoreductase family protein, partial [Alphaproteobacteria bacterium]|nr:indolepyruvate ferredoxin oxidoreductase family protein [Alphaproteobacteria bacterium]